MWSITGGRLAQPMTSVGRKVRYFDVGEARNLNQGMDKTRHGSRARGTGGSKVFVVGERLIRMRARFKGTEHLCEKVPTQGG